MVADLLRWAKAGGPPGRLPFLDASDGGRVWTDLANNPDGLAACGWSPVAPPNQVAMAQARAALADRGLLGWAEAWVAAHPDAEIRTAWRSSLVVRRGAPLVVAAIAEFGWSEAFADDLFFAAAAVPLKGKA